MGKSSGDRATDALNRVAPPRPGPRPAADGLLMFLVLARLRPSVRRARLQPVGLHSAFSFTRPAWASYMGVTVSLTSALRLRACAGLEDQVRPGCQPGLQRDLDSSV